MKITKRGSVEIYRSWAGGGCPLVGGVIFHPPPLGPVSCRGGWYWLVS